MDTSFTQNKLFSWQGKEEARAQAATPPESSFVEKKEKSLYGNITKNLYIEGENLEALKILLPEYREKVGIIYIDPPYNTGNNYIFSDTFPKDETKKSHLSWINTLFSRLLIAQQLLSEIGVIFVSINDHEHAHLKIIMDEIFGEENFISTFIWNNSTGGGLRKKHINTCHEYVLLYAKNKVHIKPMRAKLSSEAQKCYRYQDEAGLFFRYQQFAWKNNSTNINQKYPIIAPDGSKMLPKKGYLYRFIKESFEKLKSEKKIIFKKSKKSVFIDAEGKQSAWTIVVKDFLTDEKAPPKTLLPKEFVKTNITSVNDQKALFNEKIFDYAKPVSLLKYLFNLIPQSNTALFLDFFSGSATTAHAVMELNADDEGERTFIMIQRPELCNTPSEASTQGFKTISELGAERIRRADQIIQKNTAKRKDVSFIGFKFYSLKKQDL